MVHNFTIKATNINAACKTYNPPISDDGRVGRTAFMNELELKKDARVMMIHNVDVSDRLSNGTLGEILGFEKNKKVILLPSTLIFMTKRQARKQEKIYLNNLKPNPQTKDPHQLKEKNFHIQSVTQHQKKVKDLLRRK